MKRFIFVVLLAMTTQLYASSDETSSVDVFADVLLWKARVVSSENWAQIITPEGNNRDIKLEDTPFDWDPGVRVGASYHKPDNVWDATVYLTHYRTTASSHISGDVFSAYLGNFYADNTDGASFGPSYQAAKLRWHVYFDTLDAELGRQFIIDDVLTLHPYVGIKAAIIDNHIDTTWLNPTTPTTFTSATEDLKNDFWGVGPSLGMNTIFNFYRSRSTTLNLFGNFSGALLYGNWHFEDKYQNNTPTTIHIGNSNIEGAAPMLRGQLGVEWSEKLTNSVATVRLGYEAQVWFNQMQYYSYNMGRLDDLLSLQGGVLEFSLKF